MKKKFYVQWDSVEMYLASSGYGTVYLEKALFFEDREQATRCRRIIGHHRWPLYGVVREISEDDLDVLLMLGAL